MGESSSPSLELVADRTGGPDTTGGTCMSSPIPIIKDEEVELATPPTVATITSSYSSQDGDNDDPYRFPQDLVEQIEWFTVRNQKYSISNPPKVLPTTVLTY
jgi:hypothetical protein